MLKGGLALDFRLANRDGPRPRATRDMDLARAEGVEAADADFRAVLGVDLDDFFGFVIERIEAPPEEDRVAGGAAQRYRVTASLASRTFEQVLVDVGLALPPVQPDVVQAPDLLDFAGVPPVRVIAIPTAWHVAEKVHAYTRRYGRDEAPSSRPKDLIDLVLLAAHEEFQAGDLVRALRGTFESRATHELPEGLPPPTAEWAKPYTELANQVGLDRSLEGGYSRARAFLDPVLNGTLADDEHWDVGVQAWRPATGKPTVTAQPMTRDDALATEGANAIDEIPVDSAPE
jgi:Nucleotidyl transferase AbiEii toxin, Type IV TA system